MQSLGIVRVVEAVPATAANLADAYAWCGRLAKSHYENFTIASWLMPRAMRPAHARDLRLRPHRRRFRRRGQEPREARRMGARTRRRLCRCAAPSGLRRACRYCAAFRYSARAFRRFVARVSLATSISKASILSTICSATHVIRRIRSAVWCSIYSAIATPSANDFPISSAADCSSPISGRTSQSISPTAGSIFRAAIWNASESLHRSICADCGRRHAPRNSSR